MVDWSAPTAWVVAGLAGNITITAGDQIVMNNGSVSTRAVTSDGGNITLNAPHMIRLTDSRITTSVESGVGGGGNINIDPELLILDNSQILANAFGGPGGNINIVADVFLVNSGGRVSDLALGNCRSLIRSEYSRNDQYRSDGYRCKRYGGAIAGNTASSHGAAPCGVCGAVRRRKGQQSGAERP